MNFEKFNDVNCRIDDIQNNDEIPIGGSMGNLNTVVTADIDNFEHFFQIVEKNASRFEQKEDMKAWLAEKAPDFDVRAFAHMYAFDNVLRIVYPDLSVNESSREKFYNEDKHKTLSQAFKAGVCRCAEIAILAQAYFQRNGFKTKYFGGDVLNSPDGEFAEAHSFIAFQTEKDEYFYDPVNPILESTSYFPRISSLEVTPFQKKQFETKLHTDNPENNCAFLEAKSILTGDVLYYGCANGGCILPSYIISKNTFPFVTTKGRDIK
ncbi:MAG: hypothetical protein E7010_00915 [Alphaproteobacteria bacterium]|nr:hypothetical protein [Alphaproteobacteria bacterium]